MARPPATDEAFLREVDEELRRDQIADAARRWGRIAVVAVIAVLAAFGGWLYWQSHNEKRAGVEGEQLAAAYDHLNAGRPAETAQALAPLEQAHGGGTRAMALLTEGDILLAQNKLPQAVAKYAAVAGDASLGQPLRDLATIRRTAAEFDTMPPQQVVERLRPLAVAGNPWFGSAGEMTAVAYLRQNRRDLAGRLFGQIARDEGVPETIRQRAVQMAGSMGVDAAPSAGATPTP
ncbi:tetratricopeptide repeat protein [Sphingomonas sp.]|uniref:tetratricopeptide repeat protein n=1 Tax=Sphingomonas sp. TaxID=28214 RepID=UPI003CC5E6FF